MKKTTQKTRKQLRDELHQAHVALKHERCLVSMLRGALLEEREKNKTIKECLHISVAQACTPKQDINVAMCVSARMMQLLSYSPERVMSEVQLILEGNIQEAFRKSNIHIGGL